MESTIIRDLGDGLVLRRAASADAPALAEFNGNVHREPDASGPDVGAAAWTRDLATRPHPTFDVGDFTLVEDTRTGAVVSTLCLISQTWTYEGIPFGVGRPELVGTHPDYRARGLIRAQFEVIHEWSRERGHKAQAITGIPWFYRQFGYDMALALDAGRIGYPADVPKLKTGQDEPFRFRPASEDDLPFLRDVYDRAARRSLVACVRDDAVWRYELKGRDPASGFKLELRVIETASGEPVGYLIHRPSLSRGELVVTGYELRPGTSWVAVTPSVVRYLRATAEGQAERDGKGEFGTYGFWLGVDHPVYHACPRYMPRATRPYAWYVRVPDLPDFLRTIALALERRLESSLLAGHSGSLELSFYRSGLRLAFDGGRIAAVEPWSPTPEKRGDARFPDLTFLQLLFGYRTLGELEYAFADCRANDDGARALLDALFPKRPSVVWALA